MLAQMAQARQRNIARSLPSLTFGLLALFAAPGARADDAPSDAKRNAAAAYDRGVQSFERADYAEAARAFLEADAAAPSTDALQNAMVAARRANEHLLTAVAAEKMLARADVAEALAAQAREALAEAAQHLSKVELDCAPTPCTITANDQPIEVGTRYVLPGVYQLAADAGGRRTSELLKFSAGASYVIHLTPDEAAAKPARRAPAASAEPVKDRGVDAAPAVNKPLPKEAFYVGVGLTAVAAGLTTWSGISALNARGDMHDPPTQPEYDDTEYKIQRTDVLLAIAVGLGLATAATGVFFVDWSDHGGAQSLRAGVKGSL